MKTTIHYDKKKRSLTIYQDGKQVGGMIGEMAEAFYNRLQANIKAATIPNVKAILKQQLKVS